MQNTTKFNLGYNKKWTLFGVMSENKAKTNIHKNLLMLLIVKTSLTNYLISYLLVNYICHKLGQYITQQENKAKNPEENPKNNPENQAAKTTPSETKDVNNTPSEDNKKPIFTNETKSNNGNES